jgi:hypothetical protein
MSSTGSGERRAFYRLRYPEPERPKLLFDNTECHVAELSESGARLIHARWHLDTGRKIAGWIRFADGEATEVEGIVLRTEGGEAIVRLSVGVSLKRMLDEQRRLIQQYPILFERSDNDSNIV